MSLAQSTVIAVVDKPGANDAFPGLYLAALPLYAFVDATTLVVSSMWRSLVRAVVIDLVERRVTPLLDATDESSVVLDVRPELVLLSTSSPSLVYVFQTSCRNINARSLTHRSLIQVRALSSFGAPRRRPFAASSVAVTQVINLFCPSSLTSVGNYKTSARVSRRWPPTTSSRRC